jgi:alkanesulfonate monooxygenase SsuD/methylene tetrahydromethanopterin reductase-like flavin-dependent oxidoreductase (luciferase family)
MRFGVYAETQCPPEKPHYDLTWEIVRQIIHADAVGFDSYSVIEHHFFPQFGISANPLAMFVAAAQHTQRIRFRTLCHTLPLHNPLILAGAIAEADLLTHGRMECGLGGFSQHAVDQSIMVSCAIWLSKNFVGPSPLAKSVRMIPMTTIGQVA